MNVPALPWTASLTLSVALTFTAGAQLTALGQTADRSAGPSPRAPAPPRKPDVVYVPTPQSVVDKMLEMAEFKPGDVLYDLGCGDARILVTAARKHGVRGFGFDIDPVRVKESLENARTNNVAHLVTIKQADIFTLDLQQANVVTLYLLPDLNVRLMPQLAKLKPGSRILSHDFNMRGARPVQTHTMTITDGEFGDDEDLQAIDMEHTIYKWVVPWTPDPL